MNEVNCPDHDEYQIIVKGHLDEDRSYWFEGLTIVTGYDRESQPITTLSGSIADQAALHGVLAKIRDMNIPLISVSPDVDDSINGPQSG